MAQDIKQSTSITIRIGPFLDEDDGKTTEESLTISQADIRLCKNGGDFAQSNDSSGATHDENGWYYLTLDATDTNTLGRLIVAIHESGALPVWREFMVVEADAFDAFYAAAGTGHVEVDAVQISGDATAADDLELLVENAKGTDHKILISGDSQDLSSSLDVNMKGITAGTITAGAFGNDAITYNVIGTDAIGSDQLAATAAQEIADAVWDEDVVAAHNTADTAGAFIDDIDDILTDTAEIGAAGAGLTAVPWNASWDAEVESEVIDALQTMLSDSVPADGTRPTYEQALYMIIQFLTERVVTGTAVSVKKVDGSTELFALTLDSASDPTSITRSS